MDLWVYVGGWLVVSVVVFILTREFWLWYWKINRIESLLEQLHEDLAQLPAVRRHEYQKQVGQRVA